MLEFPILAIFATCIFGMIKTSSKKRVKLPIWERENGKDEIEIWLKVFLAKLRRNSTRTQKCRLISSIERMQFEDDRYAYLWKFVRFGEDEAEIFSKNRSLQEIKLTEFQKMILKSDPSLKNVFLARSEIKQERGGWQLPADLQGREISEGGEALVLSERFGALETAIRVHIFDPFLFTDDFGLSSLSWKIHCQKGFEKATDKEKFGNQNQIPKHDNIIKNFVNIELFHKEDVKQEDCVGWITIMEKGDKELRQILRNERLGIEDRKKIAEGINNGFRYLDQIGINHYDQKLKNILLLNGVPKIIDFGLVNEETGRRGYREMGYTRRGSKFRHNVALSAGTPGFSAQEQFTFGNGYRIMNFSYFLICTWRTAWTLLYKPIDENERKIIDEIVKKCNASSIHKIKEGNNRQIISEITSIISISSSSSIFCLDDPNLTKSVNVSDLVQSARRYASKDLHNVTKNVMDQKSSNLCSPISVITLLRYAMKNDLDFDDQDGKYSIEKILATLNLIIYPRSMAGLNLNPNEKETGFQTNEIELLLERLCNKTYLMESGWQIIRELDYTGINQPQRSTCQVEQVLLNENFSFTRPLTVTGAYLTGRTLDGVFFPEEVFFHQMVLDRIENEADYNNAKYVIHNTSFAEGGPVLRIPKTRPYYVNESMMSNNQTGPNEFKYYGQNGDFMWLVNERFGNMKPYEWHLLPQAYSLTLRRKGTAFKI